MSEDSPENTTPDQALADPLANMEAGDTVLIACLPRRFTGLAGKSIVTQCHDCGVDVWLGTVLVPLRESHGAIVVCILCANLRAEKVREDPDDEIKAVLHPSQVQELKDAGAYGWALDIVDDINERQLIPGDF